jgi:hypothetical protein
MGPTRARTATIWAASPIRASRGPARRHALRTHGRGDPTANASSGLLGRISPLLKGYVGPASSRDIWPSGLLSNIIRVENVCWLGNRSGTMATGKQLILSRRAAKRPRKKRMRPEPRQYTEADLERARDRVAAAARRIDNDPMSNSRTGRAGLKRAQLELSVIESQLRSRGLLE